MKVTRFFWTLGIVRSFVSFSCTDGEQGTGGIIPDVATKPVKLSLGTTPMQEAGSVTRVRGDNSLDLVLGEETGKGADDAGTRIGTLTDTQEDAVNDICVFQFGNTDGKLKYSEYTSLMDGELTADISLASGVGSCTVYVLANVGVILSGRWHTAVHWPISRNLQQRYRRVRVRDKICRCVVIKPILTRRRTMRPLPSR